MSETCRHCADPLSTDHGDIVCNCGHHHNDHVRFGPCTIEKCDCTGYDQTRLRKSGMVNLK